MNKWDQRWLGLAEYVSSFSKDPSTKVGAVIANHKEDISFGYNGFPSAVYDDPTLYEQREYKYNLIVHAELNAIAKAGRAGRTAEGATIYTYPLAPCSECAKLLSSFGIVRVVSRIVPSLSSSLKYLDTSQTEWILKKNGIDWIWYHD